MRSLFTYTWVGVLLAQVAARPATLAAQDNTQVEAVATLLAAEDARRWDPGVLETGLHSPEPLVRKTAALAIGRIGHPDGVPLLVHALADPDSMVQGTVLFALGLLGDASAAAPIIDRFQAQPPLSSVAAAEAVTALAKIGGAGPAEFIAGLLRGTVTITAEADAPLRQAALEAWRLDDLAPANDLLAFDTEDEDLRWRVLYSLARLRPPGGAVRFLDALRDRYAPVRQLGARALVASYIEEESVAPEGVVELLKQAADDQDAAVRIQAIRALGSYQGFGLGAFLRPHLDDSHAGVRVQAVTSLGQVGGSEAALALAGVFDAHRTFAQARLALVGLARTDSARFVERVSRWQGSSDWRERAAAAEAWQLVSPGRSGGGGPYFLADRDGRVVAKALDAWRRAAADPVSDPDLLAQARRLIGHPDQVVRAVAAGVLERAGDQQDVSALATMFHTALDRDSIPDAALGALQALAGISERSEAGRGTVAIQFLAGTNRPHNVLLREWASRHWPELAARWGPAFPIETARSLEDYRALARRFVVNQSEDAYPHVFIETDDRGTVELELFGPEAPLTVANFLNLVDRRFFDGNRWHRVIPDFVVQDGDPRGDGWGGPGGAIRDEINRRRYEVATVGMALSGPNTGSSQWFITLSPQPHLDGTYTAFGRVVGTVTPLFRIVEGDLIRTIRR